jgi:hemoglobin
MTGPMLERYGRATVARIVAAFYADVLQSETLGRYFTNVSMSGLVEHQALFMTAVMGGPHAFDRAHILRVHENLGITVEDFDEMLDLLKARMRQSGVEPDDIKTVIDGYLQMRGQVVAGPPSA